MNRDAVLATVIGFVLGLIITSGILFGPKLMKNISAIKIDTSKLSFLKPKSPSPTPGETIMNNNAEITEPLTITSPLPDSIQENADVLVSGTAYPSSAIIIAGLNDEAAATVGSDGKFGGKITLSEGKNTITVSAYNKGKIVTKTVDVYYSIDKIQ